MLSRRNFIKQTLLTAAVASLPIAKVSAKRQNHLAWRMPEEGEPHEKTWMGFGATREIWGHELSSEARRDLALVANTISRYEPVSMLVRPHDYELARSMLEPSVELVKTKLDDLWLRDTGPTFVTNSAGELAAIDLNFNGWGEKQDYENDALVADFIAAHEDAPTLTTSLVLEGGCIEVDGHGTAIITESCVLNDNRNPGISKSQFEDQIMPLLGLDKIIWLPGIKGKDITDGHTDFYARFVRPGEVLAGYDPDPESYDHEITEIHLDILDSATDASGKGLQVEILEAPLDLKGPYVSDDYAAGYIGYYLCNGAVIMQGFGDIAADKAAKQTLQKMYPERIVEQLRIDGIAAGGGSIHCATQQQPKV